MRLESKIEAVLFFQGEPVTLKRLSALLEAEEKEVAEALYNLSREFEDRGLALVVREGEVVLGTAPEAAPIIEKLVKEELHRDIGRAGLEVLSIVLYLGPVARSRIDHIRGVSSSFTVRNLLIRGLIERREDAKDRRSAVYGPTLELLSFLGVRAVEDLPEYETARKELVLKEEAAAKAEGPKEPPLDEPGIRAEPS